MKNVMQYKLTDSQSTQIIFVLKFALLTNVK